MKNILLTGLNGFVGQEVYRQLKEKNMEITGLGRNLPMYKIPFIRADLTKRDELLRALKGKRFDCIMHIASLPGDTGDPLQMVDVNMNGCQNILDFALKTDTKSFILASSISAYGWYPATPFEMPDYMPVDEKHPCRPKDIYSSTKYMQEILCMTYYYQYKLPVTVLRLTAVVGPQGKGGGRSWLDFAKSLAEGEKVQIPHFSADELCHYVDIRDVAGMFIKVSEHTNAAGEIFNCCGPRPTRGIEFEKIVKQYFPGIKVEYGFPWSMAQGGEIHFDMSKAKNLIGFKPRYSLEDSIKSIREWIDSGVLDKKQDAKNEKFGEGLSK